MFQRMGNCYNTTGGRVQVNVYGFLSHWKKFALVIILLFGFTTVAFTQESTIRPVRHTLHSALQSLNGSSSNAGCTRVNGGNICELDVGQTSVLVDNTTLPLSGLDGNQWARDLYTVERGATSFISIGFDFGTSVQVRRVELVLFNCLQWSIGVGSIDIYADGSVNLFPRSDPVNQAFLVGSELLSNETNSCENLYRVCVSLSGTKTRLYYIVFPNVAGSDRVYLAETIFYTDTSSCGPDTLVTAPVNPTTTTTEEGSTAVVQTSDAATPSPTSITMTTTTNQSGPNPVNIVVPVVIILLLIIAIIIVAVIVLVIVFIMKRRSKGKLEVKNIQNAVLENKDLTLTTVKKTDKDNQMAYYDTVDMQESGVTSKLGQQDGDGVRYEAIDSMEQPINDPNSYNRLRHTNRPKANTALASNNGDMYSSLNPEQSDVYAEPGGAVYDEANVPTNEYSEINKPAAPPIPQKSADFVEYLESKPITKSSSTLPGHGAQDSGTEHGMRAKSNTLTTVTTPFVGEMDDNPMYVSASIQPNGAGPASTTLQGDIYSEPGEPRQNPDEWQDIYETVYSEPIKPSLFTNRREESPAVNSDDELLPYSSIYTVPVVPDEKEKPLSVTSKNIKEIKELGNGNFGRVILAKTVGLRRKDLRLSTNEGNPNAPVSIKVAVKTLKASATSKTKELFDKECKFMSRLNHPNVIRLLGVCTTGDTPFIMMEYMENGDLHQYLKHFHSISDDYYQNTNSVSPSTLVYMATQIASAMEYLASKNFVHRDLATRNCLIGKDSVVKIADFGMSRSLYDSHYYLIKGKVILPIRWMATECFYGKFSAKTDVWAFGITIWEIFTLAKDEPYHELSDREMVEDAVRGQNRTVLERPTDCPEEVYQVMKKCWFYDPAERATFEELHTMLSKIHLS